MKQLSSLFLILIFGFALGTEDSVDNADVADDAGEQSVWESFPIKAEHVNIQILDKISGKVFRKNLSLNETVNFGTIKLSLKKAFVNSSDDMRETYALVYVTEGEKVLFYNWIFASSPSVNLFEHPIYDVRVEQQ